jgi:hypothetical protein
MAWETRRKRSYYYRKERRGARVHSIYTGNGEAARLMSLLDESRSEEEQLKRALAQRERQRLEVEDAEVERACSIIETLTRATLLSAGFHVHKRQWRRKRQCRTS